MSPQPINEPIVLRTEATQRLNDKKPLLSVVIPCMNEEAVIRETCRRLVTALSEAEFAFELIFVDDGSKDRTPEILRELQMADARIRVVRLSRNFGHQVAITAGLEHAAGDAAAVIDADLQDPPEVLLEFVEQTARVLRPAGVVIFETPNPKNLVVGACNFYSDPTHNKPLFPESIRFMLEQRGFNDVHIEYVNQTGESPFSGREGSPELTSWFYSPRDFVVIGTRA